MPQARRLRAVPPPDADLDAGWRALAGWDWREARERFTAALANGETADAHEGLAPALCWLGEMPAALQSYERAFVLYQHRDARRDAARQAINLALEYAGSRGEDAVANGWLRRAHRLLDGLEPGPEHAWLALWEGHLAFLFRDDLPTGRRRLAEGRELAQALGRRDAELFATGLEGLTLVAEGRFADGLERLDEAATAAATGELADIQAIGQAYCYMLRACELAHDFDRAGQWLEVARATEGLLAAAAGDLLTARARLEAAIDRFGHTAAPFEMGRTRVDLARVLHHLGNRGAAREELLAARAQFGEIGAHGESARVTDLLQELGADPAGETTATPSEDRRRVHGLTPRQREVLRHVAQGLSNREIGERLYLSEFTVKRHIADILTRLDLPSRAAAATFAARHGIL